MGVFVALKRCSPLGFTRRLSAALSRLCWQWWSRQFKIKDEININVKGDGQECPSDTGNTNGIGLCPVDCPGAAVPNRFLTLGEQFWTALPFRERYYRATSKRLGSSEGDGLFRGRHGLALAVGCF
jgi:hypothetical protein